MFRCALILVFPALLALAASAAPPDGGVAFDGQTSWMVPGDAMAWPTDSRTVSAWVKVKAPAPIQTFMNRGAAGALFNFYNYSDGVRMLIAYDGETYTRALAGKPVANTWVHYAGTYDGQHIRVYRDGALAQSVPAAGAMAGTTDALYLGSQDGATRFINGWMDDLRLYTRALDTSEIAQVYAGESVTGGLAGHWTAATLADDTWPSAAPATLVAEKIDPSSILLNAKDDGYRGIWYYNQPSGDEYVYKYSGGMGTYCAKHKPFAWYVPEASKTFFCYGGTTKESNQHLVHMVSYYDHVTGEVPRPTVLLDKETNDAHDNPVINVDPDGYIWIFSSSHGTGRPSYISRSKQPHSIDEFELVWTGNFSYPQPWWVEGQGFLLIHIWYGLGGRSISMMTSPDGRTWSERKLLSKIEEGHYEMSRVWGGKVGLAFNYHPTALGGLNWRTNLYYMESDDFGATWKTADGAQVSIPVSAIDNPALVHDYENEAPRKNVYVKDLAFDAEGRPVVLYITSLGYESGPDNMPRTWRTAYWTGSEWEIGGSIVSDNNYDMGSLYIESASMWRIIAPTQTGPQAYNPGGEVGMWESTNHGRSWNLVRQLTVNSVRNHSYVRRPVDANPDFYGFWADGNGRQPSESRLYFCNKKGDVFELPATMSGEFEKPRRLKKDADLNLDGSVDTSDLLMFQEDWHIARSPR